MAFPSLLDPINGTFVREMARCAARQHNVTVLHCAILPKENSNVIPGIYEEHVDGIHIVNVFVRKGMMPSLVAITRGIFYGLKHLKSKQKIDIIHAHFFASAIPFLLTMRKTPVVLSEHWSGFPLRLLPFYTAMIARIVMKHCKMVCPVSNSLMVSIKSYGIFTNFRILRNPVDTSVFHYVRKEADLKKRILIVARQDPIKGIPTLLHAISSVAKFRRDFVVDVVGGGPKLEENVLLASDLLIDDLVVFHGAKSKQEVARFMVECDFLALSSITENQPVVVSEAMCCGKPILATKVGGIPEIVNEKIGILVQPNNIGVMTEGLLQMLDSFTTFDAEGISKIGDKLFSYDSIERELDTIYRELVGKS